MRTRKQKNEWKIETLQPSPAESGVIMYIKIFGILVSETSWSAVRNLQTSKIAMLWLLFTSTAQTWTTTSTMTLQWDIYHEKFFVCAHFSFDVAIVLHAKYLAKEDICQTYHKADWKFCASWYWRETKQRFQGLRADSIDNSIQNKWFPVGLHVLFLMWYISCNNLTCIIICMNEGIRQKRKITIIMDKNKAG